MTVPNPIPRKLYIDHSVVSRPDWWPDVRQAVSSSDVRVALSVWNLFEIGAASDRAQREERLRFVESLDPLWLIERRGVQLQEVQHFLWVCCFGRTRDDLVIFSPHLSVVDHFLCGRNARFGLTACQFIRELDYRLLNPLKDLSPRAQATLKGADPAMLRAKDREIFLAWLMDSIPDADPDGRLMSVSQRTELAEFCYGERRAFFAACPAMAVEDALTTERTGDRGRAPTRSDGPDGQHTVMALAYCDIFFTGDRHQGNSAKVVRRKLKGLSLAEVFVGPQELVKMLRTTLPITA